MTIPLTIDKKGISISFGVCLNFVGDVFKLINESGYEEFQVIYNRLKYEFRYEMDANEILVMGYVIGLVRSQETFDEMIQDIIKFNPN